MDKVSTGLLLEALSPDTPLQTDRVTVPTIFSRNLKTRKIPQVFRSQQAMIHKCSTT